MPETWTTRITFNGVDLGQYANIMEVWASAGTYNVQVSGTTYQSVNVANAGTWARPVMTEQQRADHEARRAALLEARQQDEARREERRRTLEAIRRAAKRRARILLREVLSDEQWATFDMPEPSEHSGYIDVVGNLGTRYRIAYGISGNVWLRDEAGDIKASLCAHPSPRVVRDGQTMGELPVEDVMLGQYLMLSTDEALFFDTANIDCVYADGGEAVLQALRERVDAAGAAGVGEVAA